MTASINYSCKPKYFFVSPYPFLHFARRGSAIMKYLNEKKLKILISSHRPHYLTFIQNNFQPEAYFAQISNLIIHKEHISHSERLGEIIWKILK